jgi:hypothetical protein
MPRLKCNPGPGRYLGLEFPTFEVIDESEEEQHWTAHVLDFDKGLRIAACWNACEGIPTEVLEESKPGDDLFAVMRQQRDEAHTALLSLLAAREMHGSGSQEYSDAERVAVDLLAKTGVNVVGPERERRRSQPAQDGQEERQHKNRSSLSLQMGDSQ